MDQAAQADLFCGTQRTPVKTFNVIDGCTIPPRSTDGSAIAHDCSDLYVTKVETIGGNERYFVCRYDFRDNKWKSPIAGLKRVIEYYTEF